MRYKCSVLSEDTSFITIQFPDRSCHKALHLPKCFDSRDMVLKWPCSGHFKAVVLAGTCLWSVSKWAIFHSPYSGDVFIPLMATVKMTFTG